MKHFKWSKRKPKITEECVLVTASSWKKEWQDYSCFYMHKVEYHDDDDVIRWYWGIFDSWGEEWGDYDELKAAMYMTLPPIPIK